MLIVFLLSVKYNVEPCSIKMSNVVRVRFGCKVCNKRCNNIEELDEHQEASHTPEEIRQPWVQYHIDY